MNTRTICGSMALVLMMASVPGLAAAQSMVQPRDPSPDPEPLYEPLYEPVAIFDPDESVIQYDLAGPRLGMTFLPNGKARTLFGWHFEHSAAPSKQGPQFIVEKVFLLGGFEDDAIVTSGTLVFGMRTPGSFEFGVGPSVTLGGMRGLSTAIVVAAGQSFRAGGIRIPVNVAVALDKHGDHRVSLVTGWAIRDRAYHSQPPRRERPSVWPRPRPDDI